MNNTKIHIYFVPGLAASSKIFEYLKFPDDTFKLHFLEWLLPLSETEKIEDYSKRMAALVTEENPVLVGVSFGGIIVQEMSKHLKVKKIILDPVMVAKGGAKLIDDRAIQLLKNELIKKVSLITPNIPEAEILTKTKIRTKEDMIFAASILIKFGAKNVFIKGGHLESEVVQDIFVNKNEIFK